MGIRGLQWQTLNIPLGVGLNQKGDRRVSDPPSLDICTDAMFDDVGGLQTRLPFASIGNAIYGGGTISNARRLTVCGDELLCFTKDSLYSWSPELAKWVLKGTHLAAKVEETPRFVTTGDQYECDRAELNGTVVYGWRDGTSVYAAAIDSTSGAVLVSPTAVGSSGARFRLIALDTKILLFRGDAAAALTVRAIDPASPSAGISGSGTTVLAAGSCGLVFDVASIPGADAAAVVTPDAAGLSYRVARVTSALAVATSTKARTASSYATLAVNTDGTRIQVVRRKNADDIVGDLLNASTLADVLTDEALGTSMVTGVTNLQLTAAFIDATNCHVFVSPEDTTGPNTNGVFHIAVDTAGTTSSNNFVWGPVGLGSKAFAYDGSAYVYLTFAGVSGFGAGSATAAQLQNTLFLYRHDKHRVGRALVNQAAGFLSAGYLPSVQLVDTATFACAAVERRIVPLSADLNAYADRGPRDLRVTFDSDDARRCVLLGKTLYITGGEIRQYDGTGLYEVGFAFFPYDFEASIGTPGNPSSGTYGYKFTYRWQNARGENERSTTATIGTIATGGANSIELDNIGTLTITSKDAAAIEIWRTVVNPTDDAPYYLATSNDPTATGDNAYIQNQSDVSPSSWLGAAFRDNLSDVDLALRETNPENGGILESLAPPPATVIAASQDRLFLANVANDADRVYYSKLRGDGEIAAFHDALTFAVPSKGGAITGLAFLNDTLIVFRETAIYAFSGDGFANDGSGVNYGPARTLSSDCGAVNAESIAAIEQGLIFKSGKGWYVLNRGWGVEYIGAPVADYDDETPLAVHVLPSKHHVRIVSAERVLVWDYLVNQWGDWTITDALDACVWDGTYHYLATGDIKAEQTDYSSASGYGQDIETAWIKLDAIQGFGRVRKILIMGERANACGLRVQIARDYQAASETDWTYFDDRFWAVTQTTTGGTFQLRIGPSIQQCEAIKIRITARSAADGSPTGECFKLSGLALEVGIKRGPYPMLPAANRS